MMYKQGEIVLVPVPFSDLSSTKRRPVMVLSNAEYNKSTDDIIVAAITSNIRGLSKEVLFDNESMDAGNIKKASCIRTDKIYTLSKNIIVKSFGNINIDKVREVRSGLLVHIADEE